MLRLGALLAGLLLLAFLLWSPPQVDPHEDTHAPPAEAIEQAPPLAPREREAVAREEVVEEIAPPPDFEVLEEADAEPIELGDCALELHLFDARSGEPVDGTVQLWRLDVPETAAWTAGDQLQATLSTEQGVLRVERLPEGEYRMFAHFARNGAEAPPAFLVTGPDTRVERHVDRPQSREAFLSLHRVDGYPLASSPDLDLQYKNLGMTHAYTPKPVPEWVKERLPKGPHAITLEGYGGGFRSSRRRWQPVLWEDGRLPLGILTENDRVKEGFYRRAFRVGEGPRLTVKIPADGYGEYAAIFLEPSEILDLLRFPEGVAPVDLSDALSVEIHAVPMGERNGLPGARPEFSNQGWWDSRVEIWLETEDFEELRLEWKPADGPLPPLVLRLKEGVTRQ